MPDSYISKTPDHWLSIAKRINAIAQTGLSFTSDVHDRERYTELLDLSIEILENITGIENEKLQFVFNREKGYQTPKIAVRAVVFKEDKILMVREKTDHRWSIPGGYAENGLSPSEIIIKEVKEESGFDVRPIRILGFIDYNKHQEKPFPFDVYQLFMECEIIGGEPFPGDETSEVGFFSMDQLPDLSVRRITREQMLKMDQLHKDGTLDPIFD